MRTDIKNRIKGIYGKVCAGIMLAAGLLMPTACSDDLLDDGLVKRNADGTYGPFDIEISFDSEANDSKTRGNFDNTDIQITSAWVAMFDVATGKVIGMAKSDEKFGKEEQANGTHGQPVGDSYKVKLGSLLLNDESSDVYIAGVANFENIMAKDADGNDIELIDALMGVTDIKEYKNIPVYTASAEVAMDRKNRPLMAGFWGETHGNFTVDLSGNVHPTTSVSKIHMLDDVTKAVNKDKVEKGGLVHLRRLYSSFDVDITVNANAFKEFKNPKVKILNVPRYTFVQEHKTVENAAQGQYDNGNWAASTHTAADMFEDGYCDTEYFGEDESYIDYDDAAFLMDRLKVGKNNAGNVTSLKFKYWHYETKHWGLENVKTQNDRERMHGASGVYSSLCPSADQNFNNNATCILITADVVSGDGKYTGKADFYIHEGYCCKADGTAATTVQEASRDFSAFRNVEYTYHAAINGMNSIDLKVTGEDMSGDFYHGVGGELYSTSVTRSMDVPKGGAEFSLDLPKGDLYWYIVSNGSSFGLPLSGDPDIQRWYGNVYNYTGPINIDASNKFYQSIRLNGQWLENAEYSETGNTISFEGAEDVSGYLYLCGVHKSSDGMVTYYTVYKFDQSGKLSTPIVEMPYISNRNAITMGIDDHTIRWKAVEGADRYTIELVERESGAGGYKMTLMADGTPASDVGNLKSGTASRNVKLETENVNGDTYYKFRIRYANSARAMLSLLQEGVNTSAFTIKVTAENGDGDKSDPCSFSGTIINPVWDFSTTEWQNAVKNQTGVATGKISPNGGVTVTVGKLTMHSGTENRLEYAKYGSFYGFHPGGAGNTSKFHFSFHACSAGHIKANTSHNANSTNVGRVVQVDYDGRTGNLSQSGDATGTTAGNPKEYKTESFDPANKEGSKDNVYVMNSGDMIFYKIQFTPED